MESKHSGVQHEHPELLKSLPLAIDMCLTFILNIYDPYAMSIGKKKTIDYRQRTGTIRTLSLKILFATLCCANLEEKYKCAHMYSVA